MRLRWARVRVGWWRRFRGSGWTSPFKFGWRRHYRRELGKLQLGPEGRLGALGRWWLLGWAPLVVQAPQTWGADSESLLPVTGDHATPS